MAVWDSPGRHRRSRTAIRGWRTSFFALDGRLQRRHAVFEYTGNPVCIFRVDIAGSPERLALHDGTRLQRGERIVRCISGTSMCPRCRRMEQRSPGAADAVRDRDFAAGACTLP